MSLWSFTIARLIHRHCATSTTIARVPPAAILTDGRSPRSTVRSKTGPKFEPELRLNPRPPSFAGTSNSLNTGHRRTASPFAAKRPPWTVSVGPAAGEIIGNRSGAVINQALERDTLSWTEPKLARFARFETKAVQRPHSGLRSVSAVRMVRPRPFETTRKFALSGGAVGVCDGKMADREGFEPPIELPLCRISSAVLSTTQPPVRGACRMLRKRAVGYTAGGPGTSVFRRRASGRA